MSKALLDEHADRSDLPLPALEECAVEDEIVAEILASEFQEHWDKHCSEHGERSREGWPPGWCPLCNQDRTAEILYVP